VLSVLAAKAGARRVYAIEAMPLGSVVAHAATRSGVGDIVTFVPGMSTDVTLPERADVIVSDLHGVLPLFRAHLPSIVDARTRFLADGGALIPARESLHAALVEAPRLYQQHIGVFDAAPYGVDMSMLREMAANRWYGGPTEYVRVVGDVATVATLDYMELTGPDLDAAFELVSTTAASAHGFCVWFDSELAPGVTMSNSPALDETVFGRAFFPFQQPVSLRAADRLRLRLRASLLGRDYTWTWDVDGLNTATPVRFRHSTFRGVAIR
jgi:protein arginine N-methyltransferase 1